MKTTLNLHLSGGGGLTRVSTRTGRGSPHRGGFRRGGGGFRRGGGGFRHRGGGFRQGGGGFTQREGAFRTRES
eukprot:1178697-Prorocentrum_minimum.AAC.2